MGSLENIVSGILYGTSILDEEMESFLDKNMELRKICR